MFFWGHNVYLKRGTIVQGYFRYYW